MLFDQLFIGIYGTVFAILDIQLNKENIMNLSFKLRVEVKRNYGTDHIYPKCDTSKLLISMSPNKTFTPADIKRLQKQGFSFETIGVRIPVRSLLTY